MLLQLWNFLALVLDSLAIAAQSLVGAALGAGDVAHAQVAQLPFAGIVFALDGVLLGASDAAYLRTATVVSALFGFLPLVWLSLAFSWGLAGIWSGLSAFVALRLLFVGWRAFSERWAVPGTG